MEKLKVGDIVNINIAEGVKIVITDIKGENFQGVYFNSLTHEFNITPKIPMKVAVKVELENN